MKNTPALDRLTEKTRLLLLHDLRTYALREPLSVRIFQLLAEPGTRSQVTESYLAEQLRQLIQSFSPGRLDNLVRRVYAHELPMSSESRNSIASDCQEIVDEFDVSHDQIDVLFCFLDAAINSYDEVISSQLSDYSEIEVALILIELYRVDDASLGADDPDAAALDFNNDDSFPLPRESPRNYLMDLIVEVVEARLFKRYGGDLLRFWVDAQPLPTKLVDSTSR